MKKKHILTSALCAAALLIQPFAAAFGASAAPAEELTTFTFSNDKIAVSEGASTGYSVSGTSLTISESGEYKVTGSCESGSVTVKKGTQNVRLILSDLTLKNKTAPLMCNKNTKAEIAVEGVCSLEDSVENSEDYLTDNKETDSDKLDAAENAVVKLKGASKITMTGDGTLNIKANAKNGIKSGSTLDSDLETELAANDSDRYYAYLTIDGPTLVIDTSAVYIPEGNDETEDSDQGGFPGGPPGFPGGFEQDDKDDKPADAVGDGINAESCLNILSGDITVDAGDDGLHSDYFMNIGRLGAKNSDLTVNIRDCYEGIEAATLKFFSGNINITAQDDAINAANGGLSRYDFSLDIYGGSIFADASNGNDNDAIDSNGSVNIYGGTTVALTDQSGNAFDSVGAFNIFSGTVFGIGNSRMAPKPTNKNTSASDWGVAEWGSSGQNGRPGDFSFFDPTDGSSGADVSNIALRIGEKEPIYPGTTPTIAKGEEVAAEFAETTRLISTTAKSGANYVVYAGKTIPDWLWTITLDPNGGEGEKIEETTSPGGAIELTADDFRKEGCYLKEWNTKPDGSGVSVAVGTEYYTSSDVTLYAIWHEDKNCKVTYHSNHDVSLEMQEITRSGDDYVVMESFDGRLDLVFTGWNTKADGTGETYQPGETIVVEDDMELYAQWSKGYEVTFDCDSGVKAVIGFNTKDTSGGSTVTAAYARNGDTGEIDMSGDGQVNFKVLLNEGYSIDSVTAAPEDSFKNLKEITENDQVNTYRVTKITDDLTVTVKTKNGEQETDTGKDTDSGQNPFEIGDAGAMFIYNYMQVSVTAYDTQKYENGNENALVAWARDADTGEIMTDGSGQVNFEIIPAEGYVLDTITAEPETAYKNFKTPDETGRANTYRLTKMTGGATVYITMKKADGSSDSDTGNGKENSVKFNIEHGSVTTFENGIGDPTYNSVSTTTMYDLLSGTQAAVFAVVPDEGYELASIDDITIEGDYYDIQEYDMDFLGFSNYVEIRNVKSDLVVTIKLTPVGASSDSDTESATDTAADTESDKPTDSEKDTESDTDKDTSTDTGSNTPDEPEKKFTGTFVIEGGEAAVTTYKTQDYSAGDENQSSAVARDADSGEPVSDGSGQINFTVIPAEGYEIESVTATEGTYKNIKGPADTKRGNTYRVTKITDDLTITIKLKKSENGGDTVRVLMGDTTIDGYIFSDDALFALRHSLALDTLTGIAKAAADVNEDNSIDSADALLILRYSLAFEDANSCAGEYRDISALKLD